MDVTGSSIFASGTFQYVKSENRNYVMSVAKATGFISSWNPNPNNTVESIALNGTTSAYLGGSFNTVGGQPRNSIAEVSLSTGNATTWNPNSNGVVRSLKLIGTTIYAGGDFTTIGGQGRNYLAALNQATGLATSWNPKPDGSVYKIQQSNSDVVVGGNFGFVNSEQRSNLMAVSKATGLITTWQPNPNNSVETLEISGASMYVGGPFTFIGGQPRNNLAEVSLTAGNASVWNPNPNGIVRTLKRFGPTIYIGGTFTTIGGQNRNNLAALNVTNNTATSWNPNVNGQVTKLAVSDSIVYVAGEYTTIAGQNRNQLASFKILDGSLTTWNPDVNGTIYDLQVTGSNVYIGGSFSQVSGFSRNNLAAFTKSLGGLKNWNPLTNGVVTAIIPKDNYVYTAGIFTNAGGQTCSNFAVFNANTAIPKLFFPNVLGQVNTFSASSNLLYLGGSFSSIDGINYGGLASFAYPESTFTPSVESVAPNYGGIGGDTSITINGNGFVDGTIVAFTKTGEQEIIIPSSSTFISDGININLVLDLHNPVATGLWNVEIRIPNENTLILPNAFEIQEGLPQLTEVNIVGFDAIRANVWQSYSAVVQNLTNFDQKGVPLYIAIDNNVEIDFITDFLIKDAQGNIIIDTSQPEFIQSEATDAIGAKKVYMLMIGNVPAGQIFTVHFKLRTPNSSFSITSWTQPSVYGSPFCPGTLACFDEISQILIGQIPVAGCIYSIIRLVMDPVLEVLIKGPDAVGGMMAFGYGKGLLGVLHAAAQGGCLPGSSQLTLLKIVKDLAFSSFYQSGDLYTSCFTSDSSCGNKAPIKKILPQIYPVNVIVSRDPNDKTGPLGSGAQRFIQPNKIIPYIIRCENAEDASAAAQTVRIVDIIDQSVFDLSTFQLGFISIRDSIIAVPSGLKHFETDVDLRPSNNIIARVTADLNMATGTATWIFKSIDPLTLLETENPFAGFLPANINKPEGEAGVMFTIKTLPSISNNADIRNKASIYFDTNDPILTNEWFNTSDIIKPISQMSAAMHDNLTINLSWSGSDVGSGVKSYAIYYSKNGQPFEILKNYVVGTTYSFDGELDQSYSFFTIATDNVGNIEDMKTVGDSQITLGIKSFEIINSIALYPNPNNGSFNLSINSRSNEKCKISITDLLGRIIYSQNQQIISGENFIPLIIDNNGVYLVNIANENLNITKKVIVKK